MNEEAVNKLISPMAERQGFEPWRRYHRLHAFQACAFDRSATSPEFNSFAILALIIYTTLLFNFKDFYMSIFSRLRSKSNVPESSTDALPGRPDPIPTSTHHHVSGNSLTPPWPSGMEEAIFAMGCFWGVERLFWQTSGVYVTSVGYAGGHTPNPTYHEVCTGMTGHTEVVRVTYDPSTIRYDSLLKLFWESHDPTQGMRQGNDIGSQYRSAIYTTSDEQHDQALRSRDDYATALSSHGLSTITTEILPAPIYYFAEDYHQQYLSKNPNGYCAMSGTGISCSIGEVVS